MSEDQRPPQGGAPPEHDETTDADDSTLPAEAERKGWTRTAIVGTALLALIMIASGIFAAVMVTPPPDEESLARPVDTDLVIAGGVPLSWDPAVISDSVSAQLLSQIHEGLTVLDADDHVRPALAESWSVEDEGRRIVFELRDDIVFSDGTPITADDVRRSWLRVIDPANPSPLSSLLDDVAGAAEYARAGGSADDVGIRADGSTLMVEFARPASYFPAVASVPSLAVVPPDIDRLARGPGPGITFSVTGPYVPVDQELGEVRLEANERYWAGQPTIERITLLTDDGGRSSIDVFEDGAVDWTRISEADAAWIRYDRRLGPQLQHTDEVLVEFLGFDTASPPFDDPAVRRAAAMAVDWRRLAALDDPDAVAATSIVPPGAVARAEGDYLPPYDPDAARAELARAGYAGGSGLPPLTLATYGIGPADAIAAELQTQLGVQVTVEQRPFDEHSALLDTDPPSMWTMAWSADYPHAHDFLGLLLRGDSSANVGRWRVPEFDALIDAAAATDDETSQSDLYAAAQEIVREEVPLVPLRYGSSWTLSREGLAGTAISGVGTLRFADLTWAG